MKARRIALVFALLLPILAVSADAPRAASPADLPAWAQQGAFHFIRIDGGQIETEKARRTWWGKEFSADEYDVLAHAYDRDFDKILARLKEAGFNWIWVTWSNGWSVETEAENRRALTEVIRRCHAEGIHVTTYLSAVNTFWLDTAKHDPQTLLYGLWYGPVPVFYAGNPKGRVQVNFQRRLNDCRFKGWRDYVIAKAEMAIDAGTDAVFYDNMIGDNGGLRKLLVETQALARRKALENGRPKVMVYSNIHLPPGRFNLNDLGEPVWMEDAKDTPGLWGNFWQVEGARKISFLRGEKLPWQPLMYENDVHHCGARERCIPGPEEQKLQMAEARAFGAELSRNIEGRFLAALVRDEPEAVVAWAAIAKYNRFFDEHPEFYRGVKSAASFALICRRENDPRANKYITGSVQFETKVWGHLEDGVPLSEFKVIEIDELPTRISPDEIQMLEEYTANGGVIGCEFPDTINALRMMGVTWGVVCGDCLDREDLFSIKINGDNKAVLARSTRAANGSLLIHLLNYDYSRPAEKVAVTIKFEPQTGRSANSGTAGSETGATRPVRTAPDGTPLLGCCPPGPRASLSAWSPDGPADLSEVRDEGETLSFTVNRLDRYAVVVVK